MSAAPETVRLYSSWRGLVLSVGSPVLLLGIGGVLFAANGFGLAPLLFVGIGLALGLVTLFDYPRHSTFSRTGVTRRALLRAHEIPWARIDALSRSRGSNPGRKPDALAAVCGRRRYLLVDQCEGRDEFELLCRYLAREGIKVGLPSEPAENTAPTWLYHRSRDSRDATS